MGDMRAIVSGCGGTHTLLQIEAKARTDDVPANAPVTDHVEAFFNAKRALFPVSSADLAAYSHPWKPEDGASPEDWLQSGYIHSICG